MKVTIYNQAGEKKGTMDLPKLFELPWNADLVHQVVTALQANQRKILAHAKNRAEVRGGGRKPWRQKGTGRARHGSIRSPLWRKGGQAHGPKKERVFEKKIPKKMKRKALFTVLSQKARDHEILLLDDLKLSEPKTKKAATLIKQLRAVKGFERLGTKGSRALVLEAQKNTILERAMRNLPYLEVMEARQINPLELLNRKYLVVPKESVEAIGKTFIKET